MPQRGQTVWREWLGLGLLLLAALAWLAWNHDQRLDRAEAAESQLLLANTRMLEINLVHQLRAAQASLRGLRDDFAAPNLPPGYADAQLRTLQRAWPGARTLDWLDERGDVLASSEPVRRGLNLAAVAALPPQPPDATPSDDRLIVARAAASPGVTASIEFAMRVPGRVGGPGSSTILVSLDPSFFSNLLLSVNHAPDMWSAMALNSGRVLVFEPPNPQAEQAPLLRPDSLFARHLASGLPTTVLKGPSALLGRQQLIVQRTLRSPDLPLDKALVLASSRDLDSVQAPVRQQTGVYAALLAGLAAMGAGGLLLLQRSRAAAQATLETQRTQAEAHAEFLALARRGGDLGLWEADLCGGTSQANDRWFEMLGLRRGDVSPDTAGWRSLLHPDDHDRVVAAQEAHIRGETPSFEERYRMRHQAGFWVWVLDRARVVERDAAGQPLRMAGTHMDITDSVLREQALLESEQNLAVTLQSIGDAVIATDPRGGITRMNPTAERLLGWTLPEACGRPLAEVFRIVNTRTREPSPDPVQRVLDSGEVVGLANGTLLLARGGAEHQIADSAAPIRTAAGQVLGVVLVFSDVTEQYRVQQALREREQQLSTITEALPGPVMQVALDGRIRFVNAACESWWKLGSAQVIGLSLDELLGAATMAELAPWLQRVRSGETVQFSHSLATARGLRHVLVVLVPDRDDEGALCGHFAVLTDITERQQADDALRLSERKLRALFAALRSGVVVHDADTRVLDANPAACELLGLSLDQMRGAEAIDPRWHFLNEDGQPMAHARFPVQQVRTSGQPLRNCVLGIVRPDQPQPSWVLCNADPVLGAQGELVEVVVTVLDITERKLAAEALAHSREQLRTASRMARLGSWRIDLASATLTVSPELAQLLELPGDTPVPAEQGMQRVDAPERAHWEALVARCADTGQGFDEEVPLLLPSGRRLQMRVLGEAVRDASGRAVALDGAMLDVTESRQAQQQLRLLQASIERLNDVVLITEALPLQEPGPRIVFANAAFERVTGWARSSVMGRSPRLLQGPGTDRAELVRIGRALAQQQAVRSELVNYSPQGRPYWVEVEIVPVIGSDGVATHFVAVQRDISERKRAEISLQNMRDELSATLAAVPDLLFDVDLEGVIHGHHSPRHDLLAAPPESFIGQRLDHFIPLEAAEVVQRALQQAHASGYSGGLQYELHLPTGPHWFELSVSRKPVAAGTPPRFIVLARDITERKQGEIERRGLERQLREVQKMESIGTLAGGIAHDFNNILAAILGNVALARDDLPDSHTARSSLDQIQKASLRARTLVQQILTFSRRQPQQLTVQPLRPIVDETLALLRATLPAGVRLHARLSDVPLLVRAEATQLQQVLMNLCTNAWQALPDENGLIDVGLETGLSDDARDADNATPLALRAGPCAHLWVRDNGTGIDPALRDRIFDPFFTTKPVGQGTGLGLSVVHGIVRGHEGAITLDSAPGQGSTFHVWLPLAQAASAAQALASPLARAGQGGGQSVLYVDDDEVMVVMVQRLLQRAGWQVSVCGSASEALAMVRAAKLPFAAVVSDFNMPGMSGLELARQLQQLAPALPVVISSGYLSEDLRSQARQAGVRALMKKENTLEELASLLARVAGRPGQ